MRKTDVKFLLLGQYLVTFLRDTNIDGPKPILSPFR